MAIQDVWIDDFHYRYDFYQHPSKEAPIGIFLMGTLQDIHSVSFFSDTFSQHFTLFVIEVPGTGLTDPLPATFSILDQANMLVRFIDTMAIPCAHIFSISYSTPIAVELCARWAGALTLSMCGGTAGVVPSLRGASMSLLADALHDRKHFAKRFIDGMTVNDERIPNGKIIARSARMHIFKHTEKQMMCFCENTLRLLTYQPSDAVAHIQQPALLFIGEKDPYVTPEKAKELSTLIPHCQFYLIPNADHLVHLEHPTLTASLLMQLAKEEKDDTMLDKVTKYRA